MYCAFKVHVACCMLHVVCCMLHVACCMLHVSCCILYDVFSMLYVACFSLYVVCCMQVIGQVNRNFIACMTLVKGAITNLHADLSY